MHLSSTTGTAGLVAGALFTLTAAGFVVAGPASSAGAGTPSCPDGTCTVSFAFTGAEQTWTVPSGVGELTITVAAGSGGAGRQASGGAGGQVTATVPVTPGHTLTLVAGGAGPDEGFTSAGRSDAAYGGGGVGGWFDMTMDMPDTFEQNGYGGGGSFVWDTTGAATLLVAAGGGGGGSWAGAAGGAGGAGTAGSDGAAAGTCSGGFGFGATTSHAGAGSSDNGTEYPTEYLGAPGSGPATSPANPGKGGSGNDTARGGGGGGGLYGGGGGGGTGVPSTCSYDASGGGGSGYLSPEATAVTAQTNIGNGSIEISYRPPVATSTTLAVSPSGSASAGKPVTLTATVRPVPIAGGTVTFVDGNDTIGTAAVHSGTARLVTSSLPLGVRSISASYGGAIGALASTSTGLTYTIVKATPPSTPPPSAPGTRAQVHLTVSHLNQGGRGQANGSGFQPGETVTATLHSTPVTLAHYVARPDGSVTFSFTLPADVAPGEHTLTLTGQSSRRTASAALTVTADPSPAPDLANTGATVTALIGLAIGLVLMGAAMLAWARRRSASHG